MRSSAKVRLIWDAIESPGSQRTDGGRLELVREGNACCTLIRGDNEGVLDGLKGLGLELTLAYLDPPFLSGKQYRRVSRKRDDDGGIVRSLAPAFDDRWSSLGAYLSALEGRVRAVRDLLAPHGCMVLHVDPKTSHYVKVMCDDIFGAQCFASEIVWRYRRWPAKTKNFQRVHDVLLRYVKDARATPRWSQLYEPLAASTLSTWGPKRQRAVIDLNGRRRRSETTAEATPGAPMGDVWDIGIIAPVAQERTGYPTQKPEALLERVITACTLPGDLVLDPYMGSGTTLAVAHQLGRRAIGIDNSLEAHKVTRRRLRQLNLHPREEKLTPRTRTPLAVV